MQSALCTQEALASSQGISSAELLEEKTRSTGEVEVFTVFLVFNCKLFSFPWVQGLNCEGKGKNQNKLVNMTVYDC